MRGDGVRYYHDDILLLFLAARRKCRGDPTLNSLEWTEGQQKFATELINEEAAIKIDILRREKRIHSIVRIKNKTFSKIAKLPPGGAIAAVKENSQYFIDYQIVRVHVEELVVSEDGYRLMHTLNVLSYFLNFNGWHGFLKREKVVLNEISGIELLQSEVV